MLTRRVVEAGDVHALRSEWQELAERAAHSPFESPAWLLPWLRHYRSPWQRLVVTWWRGSDLVAVAPSCRRRYVSHGIAVRELTFWGRTETPLQGWIDIVAEEDVA
jgi:CelD/BcsL family acetyltransferase involved in cellulose biosynthesis